MHRRISSFRLLALLALLLPLRLAALTMVYPVEAINDFWFLQAAEFDEKYPGIEITGGLSLSDEGWYVRYRHENLTYFFGPIAEQETARLRMWDMEAVRDEAIRYEPALETSQVDYVNFTYTGVFGRRGDGDEADGGGNGSEPVQVIGGVDGMGVNGNGGQDSGEDGNGGDGSGTQVAGTNGGTGNQSGQSGSQGGNRSGNQSGQNGSLFPGVGGDSQQNQSGFPTGSQSGTAMSSGGIGLPQPNAGGQNGSATGSQASNNSNGSSSGTPGGTGSGSSSGQPPPNDFLSALLRAILGL